jgi:hypothetical protein
MRERYISVRLEDRAQNLEKAAKLTVAPLPLTGQATLCFIPFMDNL